MIQMLFLLCTHIIVVKITNAWGPREIDQVQVDIRRQVIIEIVHIHWKLITAYLSYLDKIFPCSLFIFLVQTSSLERICVARDGIFNVFQLINNGRQVIIVFRINLNKN